MDVEKRIEKIMIQTPGGTAAQGSYTYKLSVPSLWIKQMGLSKDNRQVELCFDGTTINIFKRLSADEYVAINRVKGHDLYELLFYDKTTLYTKIVADYTTKIVCIENYIDDFLRTAFGNNIIPTWEDYEAFLESRCIAKSRSGLREYLETIGVDQYDPLKIVQKTNGRMAEDHQWLKVVKLS